MKIVTGYTGTPHISSNDDQGKNQGIFGSGNCVLNVGNRFAATMPNVNTVSIQDGEGVMQGVHFRVEPGTSDTITIENGTAGYKQIILIGAYYSKDSETGVESVEWAAIAGNPAASDPETPDYPEGDILAGDTEAFFPMYMVYLNGLTPTLNSLIDISEKRTVSVGDYLLVQGKAADVASGISALVSLPLYATITPDDYVIVSVMQSAVDGQWTTGVSASNPLPYAELHSTSPQIIVRVFNPTESTADIYFRVVLAKIK